jgi:ATP synthase protein I
MSDPDGADPLRDLGDRLNRARRADQRTPAGGGEKDSGLPQGALGFAFRIATELVAALLVAGVIGWGFDRWFGTQPWGLIVFFFLGAAAGILNVYRAVAGSAMMKD